MSRKKTEINPKRAERVKILIDREKITQTELANRIYQSQQNISRIIQKRQPLTEETARDIISVLPKDREYRIEYLLGYDDFMTKEDLRKHYIQQTDATNDATIQILNSALQEVCLREGMEIPTLDNIPELLLLQAQLRDYADSLMWNYVKHRDHSHVWSYLDQISNK